MVQGDITLEDVDAIVNAANASLAGGGGVDGAIHRAGGPAILAECRSIVDAQGPLAEGGAVITTAGRLRCRHVIHTVGPRWAGGARDEAETLGRCYRSSLALAREHRLRSLAFPSIATGAYGYPVRDAARVALTAVKGEVSRSALPERVRFVLFSAADLAVYEEALAEITA